jgi:hypothetical protein
MGIRMTAPNLDQSPGSRTVGVEATTTAAQAVLNQIARDHPWVHVAMSGQLPYHQTNPPGRAELAVQTLLPFHSRSRFASTIGDHPPINAPPAANAILPTARTSPSPRLPFGRTRPVSTPEERAMFLVLLGDNASSVTLPPEFWQGMRERWNLIVNACINESLAGKISYKSEKQLKDYHQEQMNQGVIQRTVSGSSFDLLII